LGDETHSLTARTDEILPATLEAVGVRTIANTVEHLANTFRNISQQLNPTYDKCVDPEHLRHTIFTWSIERGHLDYRLMIRRFRRMNPLVIMAILRIDTALGLFSRQNLLRFGAVKASYDAEAWF
jgi:IS1 family transposase